MLAFAKMFFELRNQHTKLSTPVAHMILTNNFVTLIFEHSRQGIADNSGTQMSDMHFFGEVWGGVIDDYSLPIPRRAGLWFTETVG